MKRRKKNIVFNLLNASKSAMFSAIEIHNKPQFNYRYPTVSMLFINAWELLLKAYIYKYISDKEIYEKNNKDDIIHTISFSKSLEKVKNDINAKKIPNKLFTSQYENLRLIDNYRNTNIHYFEEENDKPIFMLLTKSLLNYNEFLINYFSQDLTKQNNLIILPIGFKIPLDPVEFLNKEYHDNNNDFVSEIIKSIKSLNDKGVEESIIVGFDTILSSKKEITNADIIAIINPEDEKAIPVFTFKQYRLTNDKNAIPVKSEDILPDYDYQSFIKELREKIPNFRQNKIFRDIYNEIKKDLNYCVIRWLDPKNKKTGKPFFTQDAVTKFCELWTKSTNNC
ncbi:MAG: DUF3644 domain-containing protein [Mycoplasmataceae bacterium]|nr:DUF3644 domain-containing protein [Mycoplasmataceae bacterium]